MRIRHRPPIIALICAFAVGALAGCTNREAPSSLAPPGVRFSEAVAPVQLVFIERTYDSESEQTTFLYQLQNTPEYGSGESPLLDGILHMFTDVTVELPSCAPALADYSPTDGATIGPVILGFDGITWGLGYDDNPDYFYSITFPGDIPAGTVRGLVTTGGFTYIQSLTGPCAGANQIAGTVFTDANGDGIMNANEFGIPDVTVALSDGDGTETVKTDADGNYLFTADDGTYTVSIDSLTADSDFNETLFDLWNPTTPISRQVTVGPDSADNDFGFEPDIQRIIDAVDSGEYPSEGKSYKWWRKEFFRVINSNENTTYTGAELLAFVHAIEELALLDEYNFTPGNELQEVYNILNNHYLEEDGDGFSEIELGTKGDQGAHSAYERLLRELLTWELNVVSGRALSNPILEEVLVNWGEGVLDNNAPSLPDNLNVIGIIPPGDEPRLIRSPLEEGGDLFTKLNGATGGGGTGE